MKKATFLVLVCVFVLAFAATAFAESPDAWNAPGPTFRDPVAGDSPHGTYGTTGDECEVCHSPHKAGDGATSYKLLRVTTAADACDYCHNSTGAANDPYLVYLDAGGADAKTGINGHEIEAFGGGVPDTATGDAATVTTAVGTSLDCFDCHSVHGANTLGAAAFGTSANGLSVPPAVGAQLPTYAILKEDPGNTIGGPAASINEYCDSCHSDNLQTAVNGSSHYMGAADAAGSTKGATVIASQASSNCRSCHTSDGITADYVIWPHNSRGEGLMEWESAAGVPVTRDTMDANCWGCHNGYVGTDF